MVWTEWHQGYNGDLMAVPSQEIGENVGESFCATDLWKENRGEQRHPHD